MENIFTDKEWITLTEKTVENVHKGLRLGQSYMVALNEIRPELYTEITNTGIDPFHNNDNLLNFFTFLNELK